MLQEDRCRNISSHPICRVCSSDISYSGAAGTWKPPAVPQPSLPRPAEIAAAAKSLLGASSQQPADNEAALENGGAEELDEAGASSSAGAGAAPEAEAASST